MQTLTPAKLSANAIAKLLDRALVHHRAGQIVEAEAGYAEVLLSQPRHSEALRLRGIALDTLGRRDEALASLQAAVTADPRNAEANYSLGNLLLAQQRNREAVVRYRAAVKLRPKFPEAFCNLGNAYAALEQWSDAADAYRRAQLYSPPNAMLHSNLSVTARKQGRLDDAIAAAKRGLAIDPRYGPAANNLAIALKEAQRLDEAEAAYRQAIALDPGSFEAHYNFGLLRSDARQWSEAEYSFERALQINPGSAEALFALGVVLQETTRHDAARGAFERCLALKPSEWKAWRNIGTTFQKEKRPASAAAAFKRAAEFDSSPDLLLNLGACLLESKQYEEAETVTRRLVAAHPNHAGAWNNLGSILTATRRLPEAESVVRHAITVDPRCAEAHNNLGNILVNRGRHHEALQAYENALEFSPTLEVVRINIGIVQLTTGNFAPGWKNYEQRLTAYPAPEKKRHEHLCRWTADLPLEGRTIAVHAEQGLGDTLQFGRYIPLLAAQGAKVTLEVQPTLLSLYAGFPGASAVVPTGGAIPNVDYYCPLLSLPGEFQTEEATIPPVVPLHVAPEKIAEWASKLGGRSGVRRVGVVWCGNPVHLNDHNRSIPIDTFRRLFERLPDVQFYSLQKSPTPADVAAMASIPNLVNLGPQFEDFMDTAAAVSNLDLVVSVDTSVAHLAGTLGKPLWVLLPHSPDWRWRLERDDTPWYPNAKLFRQPQIEDWTAALDVVVERVNSELKPGA